MQFIIFISYKYICRKLRHHILKLPCRHHSGPPMYTYEVSHTINHMLPTYMNLKYRFMYVT